ncbi:hypothetical protein GCM10027085_60620 [Spirosoma aerophilum]
MVVHMGGCIKLPAPTPPDLLTNIVGNYKVTAFTIISTLPFPTAGISSGSAVITRNGSAMNTVKMAVSYVINNAGVETKLAQTKTIELRQSGSSFDLYDGTTKIGTLTGAVITVSQYSFSGFVVDFTATK